MSQIEIIKISDCEEIRSRTFSIKNQIFNKPIGIENSIIRSQSHHLLMQNVGGVDFMALDVKSFQNIDGRATDACVYYASFLHL